jgi:hypothetical protein
MDDLRLSGFGDWDDYCAARDVLLDRFRGWLDAGSRVAGDADAAEEQSGNVALVLDWKFNYGDGDLGRWRTAELREVLLEWFPRKVSMPTDESRSVPGSLARFVEFLAAEGLLSPGSSPLRAITTEAGDLTGPFVDAMSDPSGFGMAKTLMAAAAAEGVDVSDQEAIQEWIGAFNARPFEERAAIMDRAAPGPGTRPPLPSLPAVLLPDNTEVDASKAAAPIVAMLAALAGYVGAGRKLTARGNLTLADARALVELLGTGEVMDPVIGDQAFKTTSSTELRLLNQVFVWARKAGVVRVANNRVIATKLGLAAADGNDLTRVFDRAIDALMDIGPLTSRNDPSHVLAWPVVWQVLDQQVDHLLVGPYITAAPVPITKLIEIASDLVLDAVRFNPDADSELIARRLAADVDDLLDVVTLAGLTRRLDNTDDTDRSAAGGTRDADGGESDQSRWDHYQPRGAIELTAAGTAVTHQRLSDHGYHTPVAGRLAAGSATELLQAIEATDDHASLNGELAAWLKRRDPHQAASELAAAAVEVDNPALSNIALETMVAVGLDIAEPEIRKLIDEPSIRGLALCWLVDNQLEDPIALYDPADVSWFIDVLVHRLFVHGPDAMLDTLNLAGADDSQIDVIKRLWRSPSASTEVVLDTLGDIHPTKQVAKAARKALIQHRSWLANRNRP